MFGVGTIAGMMLITMAIGVPFAAGSRRFARAHRGLRLVSGAISLVFGIFFAYEAGVTGGIFGGRSASPPPTSTRSQ